MTEWALTFFGVAINLAIGLVVLRKNPSNRLNQLLSALTVFVSLWFITNTLADQSFSYTLIANRAAFIGPVFSAVIIFLFVKHMGGKKVPYEPWLWLACVLLTLLCMSSLVVPEVTPRYDAFGTLAGYNPSRGPLYILVIIWLVFWVCASLITHLMNYRTAQGVERSRQQVVFLGIILAATTAFVTNVIVPNITSSAASSSYAPLTGLVFIGFLAYAIVRHRLFDIKIVAARTLAYVLALITVVATYSIVMFSIANNFFVVQPVTQTQSVFFLSLTILLALTFQPLKSFFDHLTNTIFFRGTYSRQAVLGKLGTVINRELEIDALVRGSLNVIYEALRPTISGVYIAPGENSREKTINHASDTKLPPDWVWNEIIRTDLPLITDELDSESKLYKTLRKYNIALAVTLEASEGPIGCIYLGYKHNHNIYNRKDIQLLHIVADELSVAVQNALRFEEIQKFNATLQDRIDRATAKLRQSNSKLKAIDETKDEFISMASHQLRTPLTSVKGYVSMVLDGDAGEINPMQRKLLQEAYASSQRMVYLIGDFLNVSRLQTGKFVIEKHPTNLADLVEEEVEQLYATAMARQLTIRYEKPSKFPLVDIDENKMRQVIMNFIDNALFYSKPKSSIEVTLMNTGSEIIYKVKDSGIGVPAHERPHLFTKFFRATNAKQARPDGTGIGLFMAKKAIVAHGGSIIFDSTEGLGSTFGFRLPVKK